MLWWVQGSTPKLWCLATKPNDHERSFTAHSALWVCSAYVMNVFTQIRHLTYYSHSIHRTIYICMYIFLPFSRKKVSRHFLQQVWSQIINCYSLASHQNSKYFVCVCLCEQSFTRSLQNKVWAANFQQSMSIAAIFQLHWTSGFFFAYQGRSCIQGLHLHQETLFISEEMGEQNML